MSSTITMINDLEKIARETETDKWQHEYTNYYSLWFEPIRYDELKILEIGVYTGASIRMWERYLLIRMGENLTLYLMMVFIIKNTNKFLGVSFSLILKREVFI